MFHVWCQVIIYVADKKSLGISFYGLWLKVRRFYVTHLIATQTDRLDRSQSPLWVDSREHKAIRGKELMVSK